MKLSNTKKVFLALTLANILWGMGPPIFKWSFANIHIGTLAFFRFAIPTILLGFLFTNKLRLQKKNLGLLFLVGFCDVTLSISFYFLGISYTASINAAIIGASASVFLILCSLLFLHEKPTKKMLLGNLIGLTGVLLIVVQPIFQKAQHASVFGNILLLLSTISAVLGTICAKKIINQYSALELTFWSFVVGTITFLPFYISDTIKYGFLPDITYQGAIGLIFGILGSSLISYYLYYWALKYLLASQTGVFFYLDPIASIVIAAPLLQEYPTSMFMIGTVLVFIGIYVAEKRIHYHRFDLLFRSD